MGQTLLYGVRIAGRCLSQGGDYFKEKRNSHMKFKKFVIFYLKITKNNYHYVI